MVMTDQGARPDPEDGPPAGTEGSGGTSREAAWDDVAARFSNLGKQVRSRFDQPRQTPPGSQEPSAAGGDSVRRWLDTLDATFTKLGDTVRDPQFRKEAGSSVSRLGEALGVTLRDLGEQLQSKFAARQDTSHVGAGDPMPDVPPPPATPGAGDPAGPAGPAGPTGGPPPPTPGPGGPAADAPPVTPPADAPPASPGAGAEPPADDERPPTL
jgi:hypothetical protein